jgi:hypothetical protein
MTVSLLLTEQAAGLIDPRRRALSQPLPGGLVVIGDAIIALRRYFLARPAGGGLAIVHRLVQTMARVVHCHHYG